MLLLITGASATGKSTFSRWLETEHGYSRYASDEQPESFLHDACAAAATKTDVVLDWAIPAHALPRAHAVAAHGFEVWWFDGDRRTTLNVFLARVDPTNPARIEHYYAYMNSVDAYWLGYRALFGDRYLDVLRPGPWHMPNEARLAVGPKQVGSADRGLVAEG